VTVLLDNLEKLEQDIQNKSKALKILGKTLNDQRLDLESARKNRQSLLVALNHEIAQQDTQLNKLLDDEIKLQRLLKSIEFVLGDISQDTRGYLPFSKSKGKLAWPIQGSLRDIFGKSRGNTAGSLKWQGVIIESNPGEEIRAIANGQVVFSDWMPSYGLLLIIDHGAGYMTLYGHNQSLYKSVGEWVEMGELVAVVGDSGGQDTPGLYFEIRHKGRPLNPTTWCSNKKKLSKTSYN
jgi:septal ring factor EnvC (AmiA/AmiB activator)